MRKREEWMNKASYPILEFLYEYDVALHPQGLAINLDLKLKDPPGKSTVDRALPELEDRGFIQNLEEWGNYYVITPEGRELLREQTDSGGGETADRK